MAPKTKTNHFLSCFGLSSMKKPKKSGTGRKKLFKFNWPKLKLIIIEKKNIILDPKTAALKASHDIMLQASKVHQLNLIDRKLNNSLQPNVPKGRSHEEDKESGVTIQSQCATCQKKDPSTPKCSKLKEKVRKDSLIGVSIMVVMLIIMSIWGRLCAILCMSAWLYCIPLIRGPNNRVVIPNHTETKLEIMETLNTDLEKKKVVLQGFLHRDYNTSIPIS